MEVRFSLVDLWTLVIGVCTFLLVYIATRRPAMVPPGPFIWPVVGNLPSFAGDTIEKMQNLRLKYGDIFGLYMGSSLTIIVSGYDAVKEVMVKRGTTFSWRPESDFIMKNNPTCLALANGRTWKDNKRFALNAIQTLCLNKGRVPFEKSLTEELSFLVEKLKATTGPVDIGKDIDVSIPNVLCLILTGVRPGYSDKKLKDHIQLITRHAKNFMRDQALVNSLPLLNWLPHGMFSKYEKDNRAYRDYYEAFGPYIDATYAKGKETCLAHLLMTRYNANGNTTWQEIVEQNSAAWIMMHEIMGAGTGTTTTAIKWILLYLIREPQVQEQVRREIDKVIGKGEAPTLSHRKKLPYVEAVIMEGLRIGHPVPFPLPHSVEEDTTLGGFPIPRNTHVLANLVSVLKDPAIFPEPDAFKPERFLNEDGDSVVVPDEFIPFSKGPRSCPGESLSRLELFFYITTLLQKFQFLCPDGQSLPEVKGLSGLMYSPKPYKVKIIPRQV